LYVGLTKEKLQEKLPSLVVLVAMQSQKDPFGAFQL
jgi:hypothetical protein